MLTHLKRELMQAIWLLLLDDRFMEAYDFGFIVQCADRILRQLFIRFYCYSADYPEKYVQTDSSSLHLMTSCRVLLVCIKNLGRHLCPLDLTTKDRVEDIGSVNDMKRRHRLVRVDDEPRRQAVVKA
jgi:hypothetical protein